MSGVDTDGVSLSVMEGDPVTLNTSVETNQQEKIDGILMTFVYLKSLEIRIGPVQMNSVMRDSETD